MIQVTFQFDSIEAAQDFLETTQGRRRPQVTESTDAAVETAKKERKPRSDAGLPRGPYKRKESDPVSGDEAAAPATQTPVTADTPPAAPAPVAAAEAPAAPKGELTLADVRAAMTGRTTEKNIKLLNKFGYAKSSDLPVEKYAEFIAACKRGE